MRNCLMKKFLPTAPGFFFMFLFATRLPLAAQNSATTMTIVTDNTWDVSGQKTQFGEYPLSAEQIGPPASSLAGGTYKAVGAAHMREAKIIPGSTPIWRNRTTDGEMEAYQFRKTVPLGGAAIKKITLEVNCDDVARVYINQRLVSVDKRDGTIKDGYDDWYTFRSVSSFTYQRVYTYDVTDYFFTNVTNTILIEAISLAFDGGHAYISARFVFEFAPETPKPQTATIPAKRKPVAAPKAKNPAPPVTETPAITVFEAGKSPVIEKLRVGMVLELGQVFFKADDFKLDAASYRTLDALADLLKRHPKLKIEIGGHTNLLPNHTFANELSTKRARSVVQYLTDNGVAPTQLTYKGYGKTKPRVPATTKAAHLANQRVEVTVLEK